MNLCKFVRTAFGLQPQTVRNYAFKSDLKIKWVRPEKIACYKPEKTGDCSQLPPVPPTELMLDYKNSQELQSADPVVKSLYQLENNARRHTSNYYREQMIKDVQRHPLDYGSMEAKLARMTATIRRFQQHMEQHPRDKHIKIMLKELIDKRKKFLKYLRRWDYRRFEWILEKLDLIYKPHPPKYHWITRKESLQKLTDLYAAKIKDERLQTYRQQLEAQQIPYLEDAIQKMEFVRKEQQECEVPVTVTEEQINEAREELASLREHAEQAKALKNQESESYY